MFAGCTPLASSVVWAAPAATAAPTGIDKYELSGFIADFTHFKPGDTVPPLYRTDEYAIKQMETQPASPYRRYPLDLHGWCVRPNQRC